MNNMAFNPVGGLTDSSAYPTAPATEAAARAQIQDPSNQLRDFINTNIVSPFNAQSMSASGYQKLPNGLIIQWGALYIGNTYGTGWITYPVTYPIAFPSAVYSVVISQNASAAEKGNDVNYSIASDLITTSGFSEYLYRNNAGLGCGYKWVAIGR